MISSFSESSLPKLTSTLPVEGVDKKLPNVVLGTIAKYLEVPQAVSFLHLAKGMKDPINMTMALQGKDAFINGLINKSLLQDDPDCIRSLPESIRKPQILGTVRALEFYSEENADDEFLSKIVKNFPSLQKLHLDFCPNITEKGVEAFVNTTLDDLNLCGTGMDNAVLKHLAAMTSLRKASIRYCDDITDEGVELLAGHPSIEEFEVDHTSITKDSMQHILSMKMLRKLGLMNFDEAEESIPLLASHPTLEYLDVSHTTISDKVFPHFVSMKKLRVLDLSYCRIFTSGGIKTLSSHSGLEEIEFGHTGIKDESLKYLATMKSLRRLILRSCFEITDKGIQSLTSLPLVELDLTWTRITNEALKYIATIESLHTLNLSRTNITDEGVGYLAEFSNVVELDLSETNITDEVFAEIEKMPFLKKLIIRNCSKITEEGLQLFLSQTNLEVEHFTEELVD